MSKVLAELEKLSSAEDFFSYLKLDYDPEVLRVAGCTSSSAWASTWLQGFQRRKRGTDLREARETLAQAYSDFTASSPIDERVFKVLQERDPSQARPCGKPRRRLSCPSTS